jgi:hypothetical protein
MTVGRENDSRRARMLLARPLPLQAVAAAPHPVELQMRPTAALAVALLILRRFGRPAGPGTISGICRAPMLKRGLHSVGIATLCLVFSTRDCLAYVDPNLGGWLSQLLFPVLVALGGVWIVVRNRVRSLWRRVFRRGKAR